MKTVTVPKRVVDLTGLQKALEASVPPFAVVGLLGELTQTLVYLQDSEVKDPVPIVQAWQDPGKLVVVSDRPLGVGGVPEADADGVDKHLLTITKVDQVTGQPMAGSEMLQVIPSQLVAVSNSKPSLVNGTAQVFVGPSGAVGELTVKVCDLAGALFEAVIKLRFA